MDSTALLYFDKNLDFQFYLSNELPETCPYYDAPHKEALDFTNEFEVRVPANHKNTESIAEGGYIGFIDREGDFQLFKIGLIEEEDSPERGLVRALFCKHVFEELGDLPVEDKRPQNCTATEAIDRALDLQNKWKRGNVADLGLNSTNFYYQSIKEALLDIQNTWGGEIKPRIEIDENNRVTGFYIDLLNRRGSDTGLRIEIERNAKYIKRKYDEEGIKTAIYPRGKGQESGNGYTRRLTIADVEWSRENGDPVDKPLGQEWIGDPEALQKYGIDDGNGNKIHRFSFVNFDEDEDPAILIQKGWESLQELKNPKVQYEASAEALALKGEQIQLGDTVAVVDYNFIPAIVVKSRIIELTHYKDTDEINIKLGNFMPAFSKQNEEIQKKIDDLGGKTGVIDYIETGPISDDDFEDVIPGVPQNVTATGLFKTISIHWDFDPTYNIAAYEVYGSRTANFFPDATTLLFRGKTGGFVHDVGEPNQKWYYKVRAINPHGKPGDFSDEVSASTVRIISDDILFGAINAQHIADLAITAEKLANDTIDFSKISDEVKSEIDGAKEQAENAVDTANQATQNALSAISQAQAAFNEAQSALSIANSALDETNVLSQKIDNNTNSISTLTQTANNLTSRITTVEGNISTLQQTSESFATRISSVEGNISSLTQTINGIQTSVADNEENISILTQLSDTFQSRITDAEGNISNLTQTATGLQSTISNMQNEISDVNSQITQLSDDINLRVKKDDVINQINLSTEGILIDGAKVHITGETTIDNGIIRSTMIADAAITSAKIASAAVGNAAIQNGAITNAKIATAAVGSAQIQDAAVTNAKIANLSVDTSKIANAAITTAKIADASITNAKIVDLDASKIKTGTIESDRIAAGSITSDKLAANSITARELYVGDLTNLVLNGTFEDDEEGYYTIPRGWTTNKPEYVGVYNQEDWKEQNGSKNVLTLRACASGNVDVIQENMIPVKEGDVFYFEIEYRNHNNQGNGVINFGVRNWTPKKEHHSWKGPSGTTYIDPKTYSWKKASGFYTVPEDVGFIQVRVTFTNNGEETNRVFVDNLVVRRVTDGSLIAGTIKGITIEGSTLKGTGSTRVEVVNDATKFYRSGSYMGQITTRDMYDSGEKLLHLIGSNAVYAVGGVPPESTTTGKGSSIYVGKDVVYLYANNKISPTRNLNSQLALANNHIYIQHVDDNYKIADLGFDTDSGGGRVYSMAIYNRTYSNGANMFITSYGTLGRSTSATKYKLCIEELNDQSFFDKILELQPKSWYDKSTVEAYANYLDKNDGSDEGIDESGEDIPFIQRHIGLIAEDLVEVGLEKFVEYGPPDENGNLEIEGIAYDRLWVLLIPLIRELKQKLENLEGKLA